MPLLLMKKKVTVTTSLQWMNYDVMSQKRAVDSELDTLTVRNSPVASFITMWSLMFHYLYPICREPREKSGNKLTRHWLLKFQNEWFISLQRCHPEPNWDQQLPTPMHNVY